MSGYHVHSGSTNPVGWFWSLPHYWSLPDVQRMTVTQTLSQYWLTFASFDRWIPCSSNVVIRSPSDGTELRWRRYPHGWLQYNSSNSARRRLSEDSTTENSDRTTRNKITEYGWSWLSIRWSGDLLANHWLWTGGHVGLNLYSLVTKLTLEAR